jgi:L-alanine-DL-glutamate epimerase-like enolase superfamily enzyme
MAEVDTAEVAAAAEAAEATGAAEVTAAAEGSEPAEDAGAVEAPPTICDVDVETWRIPLPRPWGPDVAFHHLTVVVVTDSNGQRGTGFSWTPQIGATSLHAMVADDCGPTVLDWPAEPEPVWDRLFGHLREAGGTGITTLALAAIDIALWDLRGLRRGRSLVDLLGRRHQRLPVYGSGGNFHYSTQQLEEQAHRWVEAGHSAVKIKVGRPDLDEDLDRVQRVATIIGPDRELMLDANQRWNLAKAKRAAAAFEAFRPRWLEEPLAADDLAGHVELRRATSIPIALGENLANRYQFGQALAIGACDVVQPNVARVGGITPFVRIARQAADAGVAVAPHLLPDISAQLAMCLDQETMVEDVEDASWERLGILARPSGVTLGATATVDTGPGHGLTLSPASALGARRLG